MYYYYLLLYQVCYGLIENDPSFKTIPNMTYIVLYCSVRFGFVTNKNNISKNFNWNSCVNETRLKTRIVAISHLYLVKILYL